jgi:adenylate cyclase
MAIEVERRFLVHHPGRAITPHAIVDRFDIQQGYFGHVNGLKVRVRIMVDADGRSLAVLTRKSPRRGICREEYEHPIGLGEAEQALRTLPASHIICKHRYHVSNDDGAIWSVDCFEGQNAGLFIAEIELAHPGQSFKLPAWVGSEITLDPRYGNSALARAPIIKGPEVPADCISRTHRSCGRLRREIVGLQ